MITFPLRSFSLVPQHNTTLTSLNLKGNRIDDNGCTMLARSLQFNAGLCKLFLQENRLSHYGATAFADALATNTSLTMVRLQNHVERSVNLVGASETWHRAFEAIDQVCQVRRAIQLVSFLFYQPCGSV